MAHTRKDTLIKPPEWWKHLRPDNKRKVAKAERRAARKQIYAEHIDESQVPEKASKLPDVQTAEDKRTLKERRSDEDFCQQIVAVSTVS